MGQRLSVEPALQFLYGVRHGPLLFHGAGERTVQVVAGDVPVEGDKDRHRCLDVCGIHCAVHSLSDEISRYYPEKSFCNVVFLVADDADRVACIRAGNAEGVSQERKELQDRGHRRGRETRHDARPDDHGRSVDGIQDRRFL